MIAKIEQKLDQDNLLKQEQLSLKTERKKAREAKKLEKKELKEQKKAERELLMKTYRQQEQEKQTKRCPWTNTIQSLIETNSANNPFGEFSTVSNSVTSMKKSLHCCEGHPLVQTAKLPSF